MGQISGMTWLAGREVVAFAKEDSLVGVRCSVLMVASPSTQRKPKIVSRLS